ncbi:putative pentatricopeptide repeat-containing protein At1g69350, mitochondrial isoform X1 [Brachypodium distachyon]|uniref:putative pentatricopeptide repeat-containing protein At1g69350, mitochondrial isoform X1 n=1 Tax=Brachypodium distachyon TaxID=15368 RepID=UPI0001C767E5|nr:putative pentatricopeptide repeat-containing protein At1g69350, mitochondrial isoform X1 [Brachypodium distachyon]XP_024314105.1 putative pentatricopeptide repeat-containing protein At1g69350, mitochondrial isoform X1 [Brachypodium distachyon]XP_024314106.1 putative pentatricopeptide repeat-containing protein At1g69350, mitochondrial isoform X1 [Brachypodium distachyon]XP_024314109.1 putative pentatricopeptide repeat-containing protein At1g69350, mitochondrial isoform X1 [Brachypodium distach|eukprot:XP_024314103.1 putative pentatricopeptide repeat-containing protein At1g69350, mitochondrial isoform X1 [Brachypodium distachyon]
MNPRHKTLPKSFETPNFLSKSKQALAKSFASLTPPRALPHPDAFPEFLHATRSLKCLSKLHALLAVAGAIARDTSVVTAVVDRYLSFGRPASAASVFAGAYRRRPTVYSLNLAVRCFSDHGFHRELLDLYRTLCTFGSDNFTFPPVIKACAAVSCLPLGREMHCRVLRTGHEGNVGVQTALLDMYAKAGWIGASRTVFDFMGQKDLISWNAMISGYSLNGSLREAVEATQEMQQDGMRANASTLVCIAGACGAAGDSDAGGSLHAFALKCGVLGDESLAPALISLYAALDDLSSSRVLFDLQHVKDLVSYNSMISAYMQHGKWKESFDVFRQMHCAGLGPNLVTVISVLPTCSDFFGVNLGDSVHGMVIKFGLAEQISVVSALVSMYSKLGELDSAKHLFDSCTEKNNLLWNSIISGYLVNNEWNMALDTFCKMQIENVAPDATTVIKVIYGCRHIKDLRMAKSIHAYAVRNRFELNQSVMNALLAMYGDCGELSSSYKLFQKMEVRMLISWNTIISGYAEIRDLEASVKLFFQMRQEGLQFDVVTLIGLISSISVAEDTTVGESLHSLAVKSGCNMDISLTNTLITMYSNCGSVEACQRLFDNLSSRNTVSYNVLMTGYRKNNLSEEILPLFRQMVKNEQEPNHITVLNLLPVCQNHQQGKSVHCYAIRNFSTLETSFFTSAICMYSRFNNVDYSCKLFNSVGERNIIVWNAILSACVQCKLADTAFDFFRQMHFLNMKPDEVTMMSLVSACAQLGNSDLGECVTALILQKGFGGTLLVVNALIDMHSRCGSLSFARELFDSSVVKDSVTWSAMINSYSMHGDCESALAIFSMMIDSGVKPDDITFVIILSACSHSGFVEQARALFKSLQIDHGITPRMEHYACMVDLLGRSGHLDEAYDVVRSMSFRPSESLLESLLGACRFHGNSKIGEAVGNLLIDSQHGNPRSYVMLSNIYASVGKWNDYEWLRVDMEAKGLRKDAGVSLVGPT